MTKGIVYVMTTAVDGLIKIGKTETKNFKERMRHLEKNGYYNVVGLKCSFAIELDNYDDKEKLLHEIFSKHQLSDSELFALEADLVQQLLLCFEGKVLFPQKIDKEKEFKKTTKRRGELFSFYKIGIQKGNKLAFYADPAIQVKVVGEREVEYQGQIWKLSPLATNLYKKIGHQRKNNSIQGAHHFMFKGKRLTEYK